MSSDRIPKNDSKLPTKREKKFRQTFEKMEGFSFVTSVTGPNRPNTAKEDGDDDIVSLIALQQILFLPTNLLETFLLLISSFNVHSPEKRVTITRRSFMLHVLNAFSRNDEHIKEPQNIDNAQPYIRKIDQHICMQINVEH
jgi:hypothetical protein